MQNITIGLGRAASASNAVGSICRVSCPIPPTVGFVLQKNADHFYLDLRGYEEELPVIIFPMGTPTRVDRMLNALHVKIVDPELMPRP